MAFNHSLATFCWPNFTVCAFSFFY